ncbi:MAG: hypothetical protein IPP31_00035 [Chitinophagaceae bacterium]|nr:hypothetical protein [Chitinophagaceae bacterium]
MILDNELISNRPKELLDIEYYTKLPIVPTEFNYKTLPAYLNMDLLSFIGIMPKTIDLVNNTQFEFYTQPSEKEIKYYRDRNTRFQVVHVVANIHSFKHTSAERVSAYPYSISLIAGPKRGKPDECSIELLANADIEKITQQRQVYTDFSPFKPVQAGLFAYTGLVVGNNIEHYTDTIGFVLETFFLPTDIDLDDVPMSGPQNIDPLINEKYRKYRIKRYFKPFEDIKPRKIWGCDSPIELF